MAVLASLIRPSSPRNRSSGIKNAGGGELGEESNGSLSFSRCGSPVSSGEESGSNPSRGRGLELELERLRVTVSSDQTSLVLSQNPVAENVSTSIDSKHDDGCFDDDDVYDKSDGPTIVT